MELSRETFWLFISLLQKRRKHVIYLLFVNERKVCTIARREKKSPIRKSLKFICQT